MGHVLSDNLKKKWSEESFTSKDVISYHMLIKVNIFSDAI